MATGIVEDLKYSDFVNSPRTTEFARSFSANALTGTTAVQAGYSVPEGYYAVFAGFSTTTNVLLMARFDPMLNGNLLGTRNVSSSAQNNKDCNFRSSLLLSDFVKDERT